MTHIAPTADIMGCPTTREEAPTRDDVIDPTPFIRNRAPGDSVAELMVRGARCGACIRKIEDGLGALEGVSEARLNLSTGRLRINFDERVLRAIELPRTLKALGYDAFPFDIQAAEAEADTEGRKLLRALAVAGFAAANIMLLSISVWANDGEMGEATRRLFHWLSGLLAVPAALYAGRPFFSSALKALRAAGANMDVPISLAVILALSLSVFESMRPDGEVYFDAAVTLLFFLLIGRYLDHRLRGRARAAARELMALQASTAMRIGNDGAASAIAVREVMPGDTLLIAAGDRAPVDVVIEDGVSDIDRSLATGESAPVRLGPGDALQSGVVNLTRSLRVRAVAEADDSFLAELSRLIEIGEQGRSAHVRLADRAARLYVPVVHLAALSTFAVWLFFGAALRDAALHAIALLIITCPCALGLAAPAVQVVATGRLFRRGVFVKAGDALERLADVDYAVFDKTGTLTRGALSLVHAEALPDGALDTAAHLARVSRHPIARAVALAAGPGGVADSVEEIPGEGLRGVIDGRAVRFGRDEAAPDGEKSQAWLSVDGAQPVKFEFVDAPRDGARATLKALRGRKIGIEMLTGDAAAPAERLARALGVSHWRAEASPQLKMERLESLSESGRKVLMVGDGLNDAPALARAHASISFGAAAEVSQHAADFVIQGESLEPLVEAIDVSRAARRRILENFGFAAVYNLCAMPLAALGFVTPLIAAIAMSSSSIVVMLNALRLSRAGRRAG